MSREVADRLRRHCPAWQTAKTLGPELEPWIGAEYERALCELRELAPGGASGERGKHKEVVTLRLPRWQVRRLGIIAEARDMWVGELVETWLLEWIARKEAAAQATGPVLGVALLARRS